MKTLTLIAFLGSFERFWVFISRTFHVQVVVFQRLCKMPRVAANKMAQFSLQAFPDTSKNNGKNKGFQAASHTKEKPWIMQGFSANNLSSYIETMRRAYA